MSEKLSKNNIAVWEHLVATYEAFALALRDFLVEDVDRVSLIKNALRSSDKNTAVYMLQYLRPSELQSLFDDLVFFSSFAHGSVEMVREAIVSLPREWVLANIEKAAEPFLSDGTYDEYRRLLELYVKLDHNLALKLAQRAAAQADEDIKEAGEDFLGKLM